MVVVDAVAVVVAVRGWSLLTLPYVATGSLRLVLWQC